jgi:SAM-dependent methyltransferase
MAWESTREAPPAAWPWREEYERAARIVVPPDEAAAVWLMNEVLLKHEGRGLGGRSVIDVGCGRGACLHAAATLGAGPVLIGVDPDPWACALTSRNVGARIFCGDARTAYEARMRADVAWSHGVVEHLEGGVLFEHLEYVVKMSREWVCVSAPNLDNGPYREFREMALREESWIYGFEEPLGRVYGQMLLDLGCVTAWDGSAGGNDIDLALLYASHLPRHRQAYWLNEFVNKGSLPGPITFVAAKVPEAT